MNIDQLKYVVDLSKTRSMNETAKRLFISQPAISESMKRLEKELGCQVFLRSKTGISFTEDGLMVLDCAKGMLSHYNRLLTALQEKEWDKHISGALSVAVGPAYCSDFLPEMMARMNQYYPKIDIKILELPAEEICGLLEQSKIDFGIFGVTEEFPMESSLTQDGDVAWLDLAEDEIVVVISESHPLAKYEIVTKEMLKDYKETIYVHQSKTIFEDNVVYISNNPAVHKRFMLEEESYCSMTRGMFRMNYAEDRFIACKTSEGVRIETKLVYKPSFLEIQPLVGDAFIEIVSAIIRELYKIN